MFLSILKAFAILGIPQFVLTWYLFRRLYLRGDLKTGTDYKGVKAHLKTLKKDKSGSGDLLHRNWMKFGGGFYGITAVTTLIHIELTDLWHFVVDFPGWAVVFAGGPLGFLINLIINQIMNVIQAALWFGYWGDGQSNIITWIVVAYLCYLFGLRLAERSLPAPQG